MKLWFIISLLIFITTGIAVFNDVAPASIEGGNECFKCHNPPKRNPITLQKECPLCDKNCCPGKQNCCCLDVDRCTCVPPPTWFNKSY